MSWCGQCYSSLLPEPVTEPEPVDEPALESAAPAQAPRADPIRADPPQADPPQAGAPASDTEAVAARLLAELAATREPQAPWLAALTSTPGAKAGLMVGGVVVGSVLLLALMALLGLFL
jgi:hypothetical protein